MPRIRKSSGIKKSSSLARKKIVSAVKKEKKSTSKTGSLMLTVVSQGGEKKGSVSVPKGVFDAPYNSQLVSQAVRVYLVNQREGSASTKTRGMVAGSTRKIYRQKGTGRARHGGIRAPIFVGGGVTFGPVPGKIHKILSKKMKKTALASALSLKKSLHAITIVEGLEKLSVKTKAFVNMFHNIHVSGRILFIYGDETKSTVRGVRNISGVRATSYSQLRTYDIVTHESIVFTKDALISLLARFKRT